MESGGEEKEIKNEANTNSKIESEELKKGERNIFQESPEKQESPETKRVEQVNIDSEIQKIEESHKRKEETIHEEYRELLKKQKEEFEAALEKNNIEIVSFKKDIMRKQKEEFEVALEKKNIEIASLKEDIMMVKDTLTLREKHLKEMATALSELNINKKNFEDSLERQLKLNGKKEKILQQELKDKEIMFMRLQVLEKENESMKETLKGEKKSGGFFGFFKKNKKLAPKKTSADATLAVYGGRQEEAYEERHKVQLPVSFTKKKEQSISAGNVTTTITKIEEEKKEAQDSQLEELSNIGLSNKKYNPVFT